MIDPTASDCKKVTRYVNTAANIQPQSDKLPANQPSGGDKSASIKIEAKGPIGSKNPVASKVSC